MAKFKIGDRVVHPGHQEGPAGVGKVSAVNEDGTYKVDFDTGNRGTDGRPVTRVSMSSFEEDTLEPE